MRGLLGRLRRLERLAAAIPPTDPLEDVPDAILAACGIDARLSCDPLALSVGNV